MRAPHQFAGFVCALALSAGASAQNEQGTIAPPPFADFNTLQKRITPEDTPVGFGNENMLSTKDDAPPAPVEHGGLPWDKAAPAPAAPAPAGTPPAKAPGNYQPKIPFGKADYSTQPIPDGPRSVTAVPVENVDAIEASEAAPPTPNESGSDPSKEDPQAPTELTSPIFVEEAGPLGPRKIVLRALNKVTAQAATLNLKPNETVRFGQLEITAVTCQTSAPNSQTDYAALLDIGENVLGGEKLKPLFRGWMYASSPSIASIEHPVYDVTMVNCDVMPSGAKAATKDKEKEKEKEPAKAPEKKPKP